MLFLCVLFLIISSKTFSQTETFPDGLSIVYKADRIDTLYSNPRNTKKYNRIIPYNGKSIGYVNYRCSVIDAAGNVIIPETKKSIIRKENSFVVGHSELIDTKGNLLGKYDFIEISDLFYKVRKNRKRGLVDFDGRMIIPCEYDFIANDSGLFRVRKNKKWGIVGSNGTMIIPCEYDFIANDSGLFRIRKNKKWGIVGSNGTMIIPCEYDFIANDSGLFRVRKNKKWGVVDSNGTMIIPLEYDHLGVFENSVSKATKNGYIGYIDKNNSVVVDIKYTYISPLVDGVAKACECEDFVRISSLSQKRYEKKGYTLIEPKNSWIMCKNPKYSELKIK